MTCPANIGHQRVSAAAMKIARARSHPWRGSRDASPPVVGPSDGMAGGLLEGANEWQRGEHIGRGHAQTGYRGKRERVSETDPGLQHDHKNRFPHPEPV